MKTMQAEVRSMLSLPECWIYENKQYIHVIAGEKKSSGLPYVDYTDSAKEILDELGIATRRVTMYDNLEILEYWDYDNYEENSITLPLYVKTADSYKYVKSYTGKEPTKESIEAAGKISAYVNLVVSINDIEKIREFDKEKVMLIYKKYEKDTNIIFKDKRYKVIPIYSLSPNGLKHLATPYLSLILNVNRIDLNETVKIKVPDEIAGLVIGKKGWQIKEISSKCGFNLFVT